jgi:TRAP-type uncharacterized transport system substrate-binding protein
VLATLALLRTGGADAGFFQDGVDLFQDTSDLVALASLYHEPVWVFYRKASAPEAIHDLRALGGWRIAIGADGSGTQLLARQLLNLNQIGEDAATENRADLVHAGSAEAADLLLAGELDAAIFVAGINSDFVMALLNAPNIELLSMRRAEAYQGLLPFLDLVTLPEGAISLAQNLPDEEKQLVATKAMLIARADFHPDLQYVVLTIAEQVHRQGDLFQEPNRFPSPDHGAIPISTTALKHLTESKVGLDKYLPFWVASPLERFYLLVLPLLLLLFPLMRGSLGLHRNYMRGVHTL